MTRNEMKSSSFIQLFADDADVFCSDGNCNNVTNIKYY